MTATLRPRDIKHRPDGRVVVEVKKPTYRQKQRSLKASRRLKAWRDLCASKDRKITT